MKKLLAVLIAAALLCSASACGKNDSSSKKSPVEVNIDINGINSPEDAIRMYYQLTKEGSKDDYLKVYTLMYPKKCAEYIASQAVSTGMFDSSSGSGDVEINEIIKKDELSDEDRLALAQAFTDTAALVDLLAEYGTASDIPEDKLLEIQEQYENIDVNDLELMYNINEGYVYAVEYTLDGEKKEDYFNVVNVEGEGWKLQVSMQKYADTAKNSLVTSNAFAADKSVKSALLELDSQGAELSGNYIISSDAEKNYNLPKDFDAAKFEEERSKFFALDDDCRFFTVVSDGKAVFTVFCKQYEYSDAVGTCPADSMICVDGSTLSVEDSHTEYTFDEIYDNAVDCIELID